MSYRPQPGTIPFRVIEFLKTTTPGSFFPNRVIAEALSLEHNDITSYMKPAVAAGIVKCERRDGRMNWALGDGQPLPPSFHEVEPDEQPIVQRVVSAPTPVVEKINIPESVLPPAEVEQHVDDDIIRKPKVTRFGLWSDETLQIQMPSGTSFELSAADTKALAVFLGQREGWSA